MPLITDQGAVVQFFRDNLLGYCASQFAEFKPGEHHKLIASKLEQVEAGKLKRLCVLMAPRHGKSKLGTELYPSWFLGRDPKRRVLSLSYGQDLADVFGRSVRNYMRSPTYAALFPNCQLASDSSSTRRFNTTAGGSYASIGVGGPTTGRGADLLIMDDLIKDREQADSTTYRGNLIDWYKSVARTRLQPGGAIVLIQTKWGTNDFVSWLLSETSHENWEVISLPALALSNDPLNRKPGEALWPASYPLEALSQIRETLGSRDWQALYQQCPLADSDVIIRQEWLRFYSESPFSRSLAATMLGAPDVELEIIASWDLSFGGKGAGSSFVCGQVWLRNPQTEFCYLIHQYREQAGFVETLDAIAEINDRFKPTTTLIENKASGPGAIDTLRERIPNLRAIEVSASKSDRVYKIVSMFERGEVWLPDVKSYPWVKPLLTEIESFPMANTDDCVDALSQALGYFQQRYQSNRWLSAYSMQDGSFYKALRYL